MRACTSTPWHERVGNMDGKIKVLGEILREDLWPFRPIDGISLCHIKDLSFEKYHSIEYLITY